MLLNLNPKGKSIVDLLRELEAGEPETLDTFVVTHTTGIRVLLAPPSPEMAELVTPAPVRKIIDKLRYDARRRDRRLRRVLQRHDARDP